MQSFNGLVTASPRRHAPQIDVDHTPRLFREYVNTGQGDVQLTAGVPLKRFTGKRLKLVNYLYAAVPIVPGQRRDNRGGFIRRGIDPRNWQNLVDNGPGAQPSNPGGPAQMASPYFHNPYAMGG